MKKIEQGVFRENFGKKEIKPGEEKEKKEGWEEKMEKGLTALIERAGDFPSTDRSGAEIKGEIHWKLGKVNILDISGNEGEGRISIGLEFANKVDGSGGKIEGGVEIQGLLNQVDMSGSEIKEGRSDRYPGKVNLVDYSGSSGKNLVVKIEKGNILDFSGTKLDRLELIGKANSVDLSKAIIKELIRKELEAKHIDFSESRIEKEITE